MCLKEFTHNFGLDYQRLLDLQKTELNIQKNTFSQVAKQPKGYAYVEIRRLPIVENADFAILGKIIENVVCYLGEKLTNT